jgi:ABC-type transport system involved in multi-copper enzyme maturation permease subunit
MQISSYNNSKKSFHEYYTEHQKFYSLNPDNVGEDQLDMAILPPAHLGMMFTGLKQLIGFRAIDQNSIDYLFKNTDFGMLIGILFSLLAIILSFQTISGEREDGMLKLIDSYPVKRAKIIVGKWLGIITIIGVLYTLCYLITILLIVCYANTQLNDVDVYALLIVFFTGFFYISGIVLLGIFISIKIRQSYLSLLTALLVWAFVILVLPSVPDYSGRLFVKVPSDLQVLYDEAESNINKVNAINKIKEKYRIPGITEDEIERQNKVEIERTNNRFVEQRHKTNEYWQSKQLKRMTISTGTSLFSPYVCYTLAVNEIAATGVSVNILLMHQRDEYNKTIETYLKNVKQRSKEDSNYKPDYIDIPKFEFRYPSLVVRFGAAAAPFVLLLVFNILFSIFSFKAFSKYDVR